MLDQAGVGFWCPVGRDPALPGGAASAATSSYAHVGATIGPTVYRSKSRLLDTPGRCLPHCVAGEKYFPGGWGEWVTHIMSVAQLVLSILEGHQDFSSQVRD